MLTPDEAVVTLPTVLISNANNPASCQTFPLMSGLEVDTIQPGEVRRYATGRLREITTGPVARQISLTLPECTRDQINWLQSNAGQVVLVRDDRGRKMWGAYFDVKVVENQYNTNGDVSLVVNEVTFTEGI